LNPIKLSAAEGIGFRLDKFLAENISVLSRSQIQEMIKNGLVLVDDCKVKSSLRLEGTETISYTIPESRDISPTLIPQDMQLDIIYEDESLVIINKPAGLTVHPGAGQPDGTLVNGLLYHFQSLSNLNGDFRPGIVHRLDADTTGIIVIAKNNAAHRKLSAQFEARQIKKIYAGITWGAWDNPAGVIDQAIGRSPKDHRVFTLSRHGKAALTKYKIIYQNKYLSQVEFSPETGRTHQLRVHCSSQGHPIFADQKYSGGSSRTKGFIPEISKILRIMLNNFKGHALHAYKLTFKHPETDELLSFQAPFPDCFEELYRNMRENFE